jgi:hypothetical protein
MIEEQFVGRSCSCEFARTARRIWRNCWVGTGTANRLANCQPIGTNARAMRVFPELFEWTRLASAAEFEWPYRRIWDLPLYCSSSGELTSARVAVALQTNMHLECPGSQGRTRQRMSQKAKAGKLLQEQLSRMRKAHTSDMPSGSSH